MGKGAKSQTIGYWYRLGVQLAVCHAPIDAMLQLVFGERTGWHGKNNGSDIYLDNLNLFGGEKREGGVRGRVAVNTGESTQLVDRYISAMRGKTSAQRGLLTLVFGDIGSAPNSDLSATNFYQSTIKESVERTLQISPKGILTRADVDITRAQAITLVKSFLPDFTADNFDKHNASLQNNRATALMLLYRTHSLGHNLGKRKLNYALIQPQNLFEQWVRMPVPLNRYTEPFWWCAMNPYFKKVWVRVRCILKGWSGGEAWYPSKAAIKGADFTIDNGEKIECYDMNPAHIIYKIITNHDWGMGYTRLDIDEDSFKKAADTLYEERFGLSLAWRREEVIEEFINIILKTIDARLRINIVTGKFQLLLIRNDYDRSKLPKFNEDNISKIEKFERSAWGDTPNEVTLTYRDRNEDKAVVTVQNLAAVDIQGSVIGSSVEYVGIHEPELAARVAERELATITTQMAKFKLTVNRMAFLLQSGDVFLLNWPPLGIENMALRVLTINKGTYDEGAIEIEAIEDVFGMPDSTYVTPQDTLWTDPYAQPVPVKQARIWEAPYFDITAVVGEQAMQIGSATGHTFSRFFAAPPNHGTPTFSLYGARNDNLAEYDNIFSGQPYTGSFQMLDGIDYTATEIAGTFFQNIPTRILPNKHYIVIDDEAMMIQQIDSVRGIVRVQRGALDTTPKPHTAGTIAWVTNPADAADQTFRARSEQVYYRPLPITTRGMLPLNQANPPFMVTLKGRQELPIVPHYVRLNNLYYPKTIKRKQNLMVTWATRKRAEAVLLPDASGSTTPEPNTLYNWRIYDATQTPNRKIDEKLNVNSSRADFTVPKSNVDVESSMLPTNGLVYAYNFADKVANNPEWLPIAGSVNKSAKIADTRTGVLAASGQWNTNAKSSTGAKGAAGVTSYPYFRLNFPFDDAWNSESVTVFFRAKAGWNYITYLAMMQQDADNSTARMRFITSSNGQFGVYFGNKSQGFQTGILFDNNPTILVAVRINNATGQCHMWANGNKSAQVGNWGAWTAANSPAKDKVMTDGAFFSCGWNGNPVYSVNADVDTFAFYNRALSDAEIDAVNKKLMDERWPNTVRIEGWTTNAGKESWQRYDYSVDTEL